MNMKNIPVAILSLFLLTVTSCSVYNTSVSSKTNDAYAEYIESLKTPSKDASEILSKITAGGDLLVNDLESPATKLIPEISDIRTSLEKLGSPYCRMTGSGSAVFALFENLEDAALAKERAKKDAVLSKCNLILAETV